MRTNEQPPFALSVAAQRRSRSVRAIGRFRLRACDATLSPNGLGYRLVARLLGFALAACIPTVAGARTLRVCADPNNLPFSNRAEQGFENKIAQLLAKDLGGHVEYTWWAQRRGFARNTVNADKCDFWVGVAQGVATLDTTAPYYRSSYVFVTRRERGLDIRSFDDPRLRELTIGVQMIGNDSSNTPPAHALARRGIVDNVRGYMIYGDYDDPAPESPIVQAVARGDVDVAVVWGPLAGYFAMHSSAPLRVQPVEPQSDGPQWPMAFDIAVGVRHGARPLKNEIEAALCREHDAIMRVLGEYGVPQLPLALAATAMPDTASR
jgi:quinoprotein dehydrogenase-associated probable ABC transporter substrate-binding protein